MNFSLQNTFKLIAILEGVSWILLLIAVLVKYLLHNEAYVKMLGMPHGILWVLYIGLAFLIQKKMNWNNVDMIIIIAGSVLPFGPFYVDYKYLK